MTYQPNVDISNVVPTQPLLKVDTPHDSSFTKKTYTLKERRAMKKIERSRRREGRK